MVDSDYRAMQSPQFYNPGSEIALGCMVRSRENWSTEVAWFKDGLPIDLNHRPTIRYVQKCSTYTVLVLRMTHRKWRETKQQPSMLPGPAVTGCCLVYFHFLWVILSTSTVQSGASGHSLGFVNKNLGSSPGLLGQ